MTVSTAGTQHVERQATLKLSHGEKGQVLTARVPLECSEADFVKTARTAYGLIHKLTGCNCASGRISFVVEEIYNEVIQVNLGQAGSGAA